MDWQALYNIAKNRLNPHTISPFIEAGGVAAAICTLSGEVYTGVSIDTACSLGMCAERNAIANMITNNEHQILQLVCVARDGSLLFPCGACREYLMQLSKESGEILILVDLETEKTITPKELLPSWWGEKRF